MPRKKPPPGFCRTAGHHTGLEEDVVQDAFKEARSDIQGEKFQAKMDRLVEEPSESPRTKPMQPLNGMKSVRRVSTRAAGVLSLVSTSHAVPVPGMVSTDAEDPVPSQTSTDNEAQVPSLVSMDNVAPVLSLVSTGDAAWFQVWILWTARSRSQVKLRPATRSGNQVGFPLPARLRP